MRRLEEVLDPPAHDPAPRHGDHVAASLALRADLYRRVGGLPMLPCGEDNALVARVRWHGGRVRHCPGGLDRRLRSGNRPRDWAEWRPRCFAATRVGSGAETYSLPSAAHWRALIERRRRLAQCFMHPDGTAAALRALGVSDADLAAIDCETCPNGIALVERVEAQVGRGHSRGGPGAPR